MANPNPVQNDLLKSKQFRLIERDRALSKKIIGVRFNQETYDFLNRLSPMDKQEFIRIAVDEAIAKSTAKTDK